MIQRARRSEADATPRDETTWRKTRLKFTIDRAVAGDWGADAEGNEDDVLCIRVADFDFDRGGLKGHPYTSRSIPVEKRRGRLLRSGDLLLEKSGGGERTSVGRVVLVQRDFDGPATCSNFVARMRPLPEFEPRFLCFLHHALFFAGTTQQSVKQTTGIQNLDVSHYLGRQILVPTRRRQQLEADFLDEQVGAIHQLASRKRAMLGLLGEKRAVVVLNGATGVLVSRDRVLSDLPWAPSLPAHWRATKLSLVAKLGTGHTPGRASSEYWSGERDVPWLTTGDISKFRDDRLSTLHQTLESITRTGLDHSSAVLHAAGTVALSRTASVGFSVIMGKKMATSQDFVTWTCSDLIEPGFLLLCLRAMRADLVGRLATGSTHKTIYMAAVQGLRIPLPPVEEQRRIVDYVKVELARVDKLSRLIEVQLPLLEERRQAIIIQGVLGDPVRS